MKFELFCFPRRFEYSVYLRIWWLYFSFRWWCKLVNY